MRFLEPFQKELVSLGFALLTALVLWLFRARVRLLWGLTHGFAFMIRPTPPAPAAQGGAQLPAPQPFLILSTSLILVNDGRVPATNVEVVFNWQPENFEVWPARPYQTVTGADGRFTLQFANVAPKEQFQIELLTAHRRPDMLNVRCSECVGRAIPMRPMRILPKWASITFWSLAFLGLAAVIYIVISVGTLFLNAPTGAG